MSKYTALYARTYFAEPGRICQQIGKLTRIAREKKLGNLRLFIYDGYAGDADHRPAFTSLMEEIRNNRIGTVIVEHMGRLERRPSQFRDTVRMIHEQSVRLILVNESIDILPDDVQEDENILDLEPHFQDSSCEATNQEIGKWGQLRSDLLVEERPGEYCRLFSDDMLDQTMIEINEAAEKRMAELVQKMQESEGVTEKLKVENRNEWILRMNSIRARAADIVKEEIIFT